MTAMEDGLARARRALGTVSGELDVTWDDVLERAQAGCEVVPVVPLGDARRRRPTTSRRVAVAAALVALVAGIGGVVHAMAGRDAPLPPAGTASVVAPEPLDSDVGPSSDAAQVIVDRARDAFHGTLWCGASLKAGDPRTALLLDEGLGPSALDDEHGKRGRSADGELVAVDTGTGTWWKLRSAADIVADRPDLQAAIAALQLLVDKGGTWRPADDGTPDAVTVDVGAGPVTVVVDRRSGLPARVIPAVGGTGGLDVVWLSCAIPTDGGAGDVTVPPGYADASDSR